MNLSAPPSASSSTGDGRPARTPSADRSRWTRRALWANLVAQIGIIVTGGAVRLTASGLGCSTWPQCEPGSFTPAFHAETPAHAYIEFGNRTLTGVVGVLALAVAWLLWTRRDRALSFRLLALVPLLGVAVQAVVGGATVIVDLHPAVVGFHLLISMGLVWASTVLLVREAEGDGPPVPLVATRLVTTGHVLTAVLVPVLVLGVLTTGSGPHAGDDEAPYRFALDPALMARFHAATVWLFLAVTAVLVIGLLRRPSPAPARRAAVWLVVVVLLQGAIGYVQYFTGLPELLVGVHMLGAALLTAGTASVVVQMRVRGDG